MASQNDNAAMVRHWLRIGPLLAEIRDRELRELTPEGAQRAIANVLDLGQLVPVNRPTSGLVEQQRLFQQWRR